MSAYIVEDQTINAIVSHIQLYVEGNRDLGYQYKHLLRDYAPFDDKQIERLANDMFALNCNSIEQRYGSGEPEKFRSLDFKYKFTLTGNKYQILKTLKCWLYQCAEGDIPKKSKLYKSFREIESAIALDIVCSSEEFDKAKWA